MSKKQGQRGQRALEISREMSDCKRSEKLEGSGFWTFQGVQQGGLGMLQDIQVRREIVGIGFRLRWSWVFGLGMEV